MSEIKVNKISPRTNCGTTQLGDSGDTFNLPSGGTLTIASGATITNNGTANNFGATGSVNWQTTVKTSGFTAVNGEGYFVDTSSGAISVNLPAGTAGAVVGFKDYANTFDTAEVTLVQNGSDKIGGSTVNAKLDVEGLAITLVFVDATKGWLVTDSGLQSEAPTQRFVAATGGTITQCGNFKVHKFTGPGTFTVTCAGNASGSNTIDYVVVAGAGSAAASGGGGGGGGGAGGFRLSNSAGCIPAPTMSPLVACAGLTLPATSYPVVVGAGGAEAPGAGNNGSNSSFGPITAGYGGAGGNGDSGPGANGGSGGGSKANGGTGNTPPVSPPQGNDGAGGAPNGPAGGGGGAGAAGTAGTPSGAGSGGAGSFVSPSFAVGCAGTTGPVPSVRYFAGGGAGGPPVGAGGTGGAGGGADSSSTGTIRAGTVNTGGGGGGNWNGNGGAGGSGIVLIRYKFQ
tara:strand:- start:56 stop:1420 length:1365 start_codon:yes stop_codon:yes gene_type:complete